MGWRRTHVVWADLARSAVGSGELWWAVGGTGLVLLCEVGLELVAVFASAFEGADHGVVVLADGAVDATGLAGVGAAGWWCEVVGELEVAGHAEDAGEERDGLDASDADVVASSGEFDVVA